jgi:hypothetical protein
VSPGRYRLDRSAEGCWSVRRVDLPIGAVPHRSDGPISSISTSSRDRFSPARGLEAEIYAQGFSVAGERVLVSFYPVADMAF